MPTTGAGATQASSKTEGWKSLFDGKTLDGWHPVGDGKWTVEDGAIVGRANKEKLYGLLFSDDEYQDFHGTAQVQGAHRRQRVLHSYRLQGNRTRRTATRCKLACPAAE